MLARRDVLKGSVALLLLPMAGCGPSEGPAPVAWERDACTHCRMIISERQFAAELRGGPAKKLYKFDDLGCAVHWAKDQGWSDFAEFWVMSHDDGATWLDARQAHFLFDVRSPMGYNFAAVPDGREKSVPYAEMMRRLAVGNSHSFCPSPNLTVAESR